MKGLWFLTMTLAITASQVMPAPLTAARQALGIQPKTVSIEWTFTTNVMGLNADGAGRLLYSEPGRVRIDRSLGENPAHRWLQADAIDQGSFEAWTVVAGQTKVLPLSTKLTESRGDALRFHAISYLASLLLMTPADLGASIQAAASDSPDLRLLVKPDKAMTLRMADRRASQLLFDQGAFTMISSGGTPSDAPAPSVVHVTVEVSAFSVDAGLMVPHRMRFTYGNKGEFDDVTVTKYEFNKAIPASEFRAPSDRQ